MSSEKIINQIDLYFDGELTKEEEAYLFSELSADIEAREYFKNANRLKTFVKSGMEVFPDELEERILRNIENKSGQSFFRLTNRNIYTFVSYAISILLVVISFYFFTQNNNYKTELDSTKIQLSNQNKLINMLYDSLPTAEVKTTVDYKVIVTDEL